MLFLSGSFTVYLGLVWVSVKFASGLFKAGLQFFAGWFEVYLELVCKFPVFLLGFVSVFPGLGAYFKIGFTFFWLRLGCLRLVYG